MKTNQQKIQIAKKFISLHKNNDIENWTLGSGFTANDNENLETIYHNLVGGKHGEIGETEYPGEYKIEIGRFDSKNGIPIIFEWEIEMDTESKEYEVAEDWVNASTKDSLINYANKKGLNIGQDEDQLHEDWHLKILFAKYDDLQTGGVK